MDFPPFDWDIPIIPGRHGCTILDEMWRTRSVPSLAGSRLQSETAPATDDESRPRNDSAPRVRKSRSRHDSAPRVRKPRTAAVRAAEEDAKLWTISASADDYEASRAALYDEKRTRRASWASKSAFHPFPRLPPELRHYVWKLATEEPTRVHFSVTEYREAYSERPEYGLFPLSWSSGTTHLVSARATAYLPPYLLVSREAHDVARRLYRRAFRSYDGSGGVLAAYPTALRVDGVDSFRLIHADDLDELVSAVTVARGRDPASPEFMWDGDMISFDRAFRIPGLRRLEVRGLDWWDRVTGVPALCKIINPELDPNDNARTVAGSLAKVPPPSGLQVVIELENRREDDGSEDCTFRFAGDVSGLPRPIPSPERPRITKAFWIELHALVEFQLECWRRSLGRWFIEHDWPRQGDGPAGAIT
ncbi:hypothetical protein F4808DRAFT_443655 [Astrocystis sublimbata]|nr:hypothetical protein F4808DRAFT_443655 [Astrocystis sublimbata]